MKRWMLAVLFICAIGVTQAQTADSSRTRFRGGAQAASSAGSQRMDRFIDKDGDGICDGRASGLGVRREGQGMNRIMNGNANGTAGQGRGKKQQKGQK